MSIRTGLHGTARGRRALPGGARTDDSTVGKRSKAIRTAAKRPVRASLSAAALVVDWATLAALGAATVALVVTTWRPPRRDKS